MDTKPRQILIVALDNLGDVVFASALTPPLHAAFPDATIDVWCKAYTADVAALIPHVTNVVAADPFWAVHPHRPRASTLAFLRSVRRVARTHYDVAILSEAPWRAAAAVGATRIPIRIGLARRHNRHFLTHMLDAEDAHKPVVREQARLLAALGITVAHPRYRLDVSRLGPDRFGIASQLPPRFVALHPFAGQRDRCVALAEWIQMACVMHMRGHPVLWVGTSAELEQVRRSHTGLEDCYVDELHHASMKMTAAALSHARLFVGHDSGPLHIAAALGVPVVGVFAPGQPDRTSPQGFGPWRVIAHPSPVGITAAAMLREVESLGLFSTP